MKLEDGEIKYYNRSILSDSLIFIYVVSVYILSYMVGFFVLSNVIFVLLIASMLFYLFFRCRGGRVYFDKTIGLYTIFVFVCIVSVSYAKYKVSATNTSQTLFLFWIMMFVMFNYLCNTKNDKILIYSMLIGGIIYSVYVILYYGPAGYYDLMVSGTRAGSEITNVNTIGIISSSTFILAFYFALYKKLYFMYGVMIIPLITAFGSGSRKALVSIGLGVLILYLLKYANDKRISTLIKVLVAIVVAFILLQYLLTLPAFQSVNDRFDQFLHLLSGKGKADISAVIRQNMVKYGLRESRNHLLIGNGINNSKIVTLKYFNESTYLHNNYVELLYDVGLIGLLSYYSVFAFLIYRITGLVKKKVKYSQVLFTLLIIKIIMDIGAVSYYSKETYILIIAITAFIKINELKERESINEENHQGLQGS